MHPLGYTVPWSLRDKASGRFAPRSRLTELSIVFRVLYGSYRAAARRFDVTPRSLQRWRCNHLAAPPWVLFTLSSDLEPLVNQDLAKPAHERCTELLSSWDYLEKLLRTQPLRPERRLVGVCEGRTRKRPTRNGARWGSLLSR